MNTGHLSLNADRSQRCVVHSPLLDWVDAPAAGVSRRMLERDGGEVARATSIVRYAPGSAFAGHTHGGGEEILVLEGTLHDEHGVYGPGTYIHNPVGSAHAPSSPEGCTLFVKLRHLDPRDDERRRDRDGVRKSFVWSSRHASFLRSRGRPAGRER